MTHERQLLVAAWFLPRTNLPPKVMRSDPNFLACNGNRQIGVGAR